MNWSFINGFISIFCLWGVCATVEITPSMSASLNKLTFQISSWQNSERCGGVVITPNAKLTHSPQKFSPPVSKPALRNQQAYATSWTNVNKKSICFKTQSVLSVMKGWCAVTMLSGEAPAHKWSAVQSPAAEHHDQLFNPDSFLTPALVRSCSWQAQIWRGLRFICGIYTHDCDYCYKEDSYHDYSLFSPCVGGDFHYRYMIQSPLDCKHEPLYCFYLFWSGVQSFGTAQCLYRPVQQFVFSRSGGQKELLEHKEQRIILGSPFTFSTSQVFHCNTDCLKVFLRYGVFILTIWLLGGNNARKQVNMGSICMLWDIKQRWSALMPIFLWSWDIPDIIGCRGRAWVGIASCDWLLGGGDEGLMVKEARCWWERDKWRASVRSGHVLRKVQERMRGRMEGRVDWLTCLPPWKRCRRHSD